MRAPDAGDEALCGNAARATGGAAPNHVIFGAAHLLGVARQASSGVAACHTGTATPPPPLLLVVVALCLARHSSFPPVGKRPVLIVTAAGATCHVTVSPDTMY